MILRVLKAIWATKRKLNVLFLPCLGSFLQDKSRYSAHFCISREATKWDLYITPRFAKNK